jgi:3-hydroxybutyryl-CoA dehydrogenase
MSNERIGVVGLGLLGRGIAACFLSRGFEVVAVDHSAAQRESARCHIERMIDELVRFGGLDTGLRAKWASLYKPVSEFEALKDCSFIVESVAEDAAAKTEVCDRIEEVVSPQAIIATNTSAIPITKLQAGRKHPERFIGMHWAEPAHITRFIEIIPGEQTSQETVEATLALARRLGKDPSLCRKDIPAFIVNRLGYALYREALHLIELGVADAATIDRAMRNVFGLWTIVCGPFRWIDITGGPELYARAMKGVLPTLSNADAVSPVLQDLADSGARGIINGHGFFDYTPEEAKSWEELYRKHSWRVTQMQNEYFPLEDEARWPILPEL